MIKVTCTVPTIDDPKDTKIAIESDELVFGERRVVIDIRGSRYIVNGDDLMTAIENAMHDASRITYSSGRYSR